MGQWPLSGLMPLVAMHLPGADSPFHSVMPPGTCTHHTMSEVKGMVGKVRGTECGLVQVTDAWVETAFPGQGSLANLRNNLHQAVQLRAQQETQDRVRMAINNHLSNMVQVEVPECMIEEVAKNEFQAKLFEVGQKVRRRAGACVAVVLTHL